MKSRIMIVDDEVELCSMLQTILECENYNATSLNSAAALQEAQKGPAPDLILLDLKLKDGDGLELLPGLKKNWPSTEVVILTGNATSSAAFSASKLGAYGFLEKPYKNEALLLMVSQALDHKNLTEQTQTLRQAVSTMSGGNEPIYQSVAMKTVVRTVERVAASDVSVFITGESGTGKEVVADLIHSLSARSKGPFIKINCAALPRELIESELFGSVKGAYTGSQSDREGFFRQAEGGTLLLDELSEMPIDTQSKLLRVLQEKEFRPVGGRTSYKADCRVLASTNRLIESALKEGKLREDLYYRISTISITLSPLRERREDIMPLATAFLKRYAAQAGQPISGFTEAAADLLRKFDWPGNVRQLQNEIQRAVLLCEGQKVDAGDLSILASPGTQSDVDLSILEAMERSTIVQMLAETRGNKVETAKRLGIGRQTLYNKIKSYGIDA